MTIATPDWDSEDIVIFREFLKTRTGLRLIPRLLEAVPPLLTGGDTTAVFIRSGEVRGCQMMAQELFLMANPPADKKEDDSTHYPSLTDDSAWEGDKLTK